MRKGKGAFDLRWELLPLALLTLAFALGFVLYGGRLDALQRIGTEQYGEEWDSLRAWLQWGVPLAGLGVYAALSLGMWAVARVGDPLRDWNALARLAGRGAVEDPARKEAARAVLLRGQFLLKTLVAALVLFAQWRIFQVVAERLGQAP